MSKIKTSTSSFIAFDVVDFYPFISLDLLNDALDFAANYANITGDERHIITHAKKSCLFSSGEQWCKKSSSNLFDITMCSYDGPETCDCVDFLDVTLNLSNGKHMPNPITHHSIFTANPTIHL